MWESANLLRFLLSRSLPPPSLSFFSLFDSPLMRKDKDDKLRARMSIALSHSVEI